MVLTEGKNRPKKDSKESLGGGWQSDGLYQETPASFASTPAVVGNGKNQNLIELFLKERAHQTR